MRTASKAGFVQKDGNLLALDVGGDVLEKRLQDALVSEKQEHHVSHHRPSPPGQCV
jgi:hypothetical protein